MSNSTVAIRIATRKRGIQTVVYVPQIERPIGVTEAFGDDIAPFGGPSQ
jgi:hypothetical protein